MFYGHPVERLCTYQYSLVSLVPGLLQNLDDSGSPPLASRAQTLSRPTSLKTSDRKSMMAYSGLPLDLFGKDAFFQPYLPLQQIDMLKDTKSWLCGCTNSIVSQQKEVDLLINVRSVFLASCHASFCSCASYDRSMDVPLTLIFAVFDYRLRMALLSSETISSNDLLV